MFRINNSTTISDGRGGGALAGHRPPGVGSHTKDGSPYIGSRLRPGDDDGGLVICNLLELLMFLQEMNAFKQSNPTCTKAQTWHQQ